MLLTPPPFTGGGQAHLGIRGLVGVGNAHCAPSPSSALPPRQAAPPPHEGRAGHGCTSIHFGENQLSPGSIGISPLPTGHPPVLQHRWVRASTRSYPRFTLPMGSSPGFGSYPGNANCCGRTRVRHRAPCSDDSLSLRLHGSSCARTRPTHCCAHPRPPSEAPLPLNLVSRRDHPPPLRLTRKRPAMARRCRHTLAGSFFKRHAVRCQPPPASRRTATEPSSDCLLVQGFRVSFIPLAGCFSPFPHGTRSLSVALST
jgi:hypothetical protein